MKAFFSPDPYRPREVKALLRMLTGLLMACHGWEVFDGQKIVEYAAWKPISSAQYPALLVYLGKGAELVAGVLLFLGLFTRIAAVFLIFTMLYIVFFIGNGRVWYEEQHPFLFLVLGIYFLFSGGGKWSLDDLFFQRSLPGRRGRLQDEF